MNSFVGELLIFFGLFKQNPWLTSFLGLSIVLSVIYMLRWMQKVYFGSPSPAPELSLNTWIDIKGKELAIAVPLMALILWIGIYPKPLLKQIEPAAEKTVAIAQLKEHA